MLEKHDCSVKKLKSELYYSSTLCQVEFQVLHYASLIVAHAPTAFVHTHTCTDHTHTDRHTHTHIHNHTHTYHTHTHIHTHAHAHIHTHTPHTHRTHTPHTHTPHTHTTHTHTPHTHTHTTYTLKRYVNAFWPGDLYESSKIVDIFRNVHCLQLKGKPHPFTILVFTQIIKRFVGRPGNT